jgi:hypothetical protein
LAQALRVGHGRCIGVEDGVQGLDLGRVDAEASPHDLDGLVQACAAALRDRPLRAQP